MPFLLLEVQILTDNRRKVPRMVQIETDSRTMDSISFEKQTRGLLGPLEVDYISDIKELLLS
jgi:hypothetical protein